MEKFTSKEHVKFVADRWRNTYYYGGAWYGLGVKDAKTVYEKLVALGDNPDPEDVFKITLSMNMAYPYCPKCDDYHDEVYIMECCGEYICETCFGQHMVATIKETAEFAKKNMPELWESIVNGSV